MSYQEVTSAVAESESAAIIYLAIKYIVLTYLIGALENPAQMRKSA